MISLAVDMKFRLWLLKKSIRATFSGFSWVAFSASIPAPPPLSPWSSAWLLLGSTAVFAYICLTEDRALSALSSSRVEEF